MPFIVSPGIFKDKLGQYDKIANTYRKMMEKIAISVPIDWDNNKYYMIVYLMGFLGLLGDLKPHGILIINSFGQKAPRQLAEEIVRHICLYFELSEPSDTWKVYNEGLKTNYPQLFETAEQALIQAKSDYSHLYQLYKGWDKEKVKLLFDKIIYMVKARKEFGGQEDLYKKKSLEKAKEVLVNSHLSSARLKEMMYNYIQLGIYDYKHKKEILKGSNAKVNSSLHD